MTDPVSRWIAIGAFLMAFVSLVLQYVTWRRGAPQVTVTVEHALLTHGGGHQVITIKAYNTGTDVQVTSFWLDPGQGQAKLYILTPVAGSASLPYLLKNGHDVGWFADLRSVQEAAVEYGFTSVRAGVALATGATCESKRSVEVFSGT